MKRFLLILLGIVLLLSSCRSTGKPVNTLPSTQEQTTPSDTSTVVTDTTETEDTTLNTTVTLPQDTSEEEPSGNIECPALIETIFPTEDVVIADYIVTNEPYKADPTGKEDAASAIQKALNDCSAAGGGTVYLPAGQYRVNGNLTVPPFVTLRGDWCPPENDGFLNGTVILAYPGAESESPALFDIGGSAGVLGLTVYYPEQSLEDVKEYPYTFYTNGIGNNYMLATVKNVTVVNGYRGIGACCLENSPHEMMTVENFYGTFLSFGAQVYNQADVGTWKNVNIGNRYWLMAGDACHAPKAADLEAYTKANTVGLILGDLEWTEFTGLTVSDCKLGIRIVKGQRIEFAGSLMGVKITNCVTGLHAEVMDNRWGMLIAESVIEGDTVAIRNDSEGAIKLSGVTLKGTLEGSGEILNDNTAPAGRVPSLSYGYVKPAGKLYVAELKTGILSSVTDDLQKILNEAGKTGGVVYIPAGTYTLSQPVTVPAGVELRGATSLPTRDQGGLSLGTVIVCRYGVGEEYNAETQALITLAGENAGLNGIRIVCVSNSPNNRKSTGYLVRGTADGVYCVNCSFVASDYGIDFRGCDNTYIKKLIACCYKETITVGGKNAVIEGCLQNGNVLCRCSTKGISNWVPETQIFDIVFPITRSECTYIRLVDAENATVFNTFAYGVHHLVVSDNSKNTMIANVGADNLGGTLLVTNGGSTTGVNIMRWNGSSYENNGGKLLLLNRITINDKYETAVEE